LFARPVNFSSENMHATTNNNKGNNNINNPPATVLPSHKEGVLSVFEYDPGLRLCLGRFGTEITLE
jgi:hypothetical protein